MGPEATLFVLLAVATVVALLARALRIPYAVALVAAGLGLAMVPLLHPPELTLHFLYDVILPGLVFESAFHLDLGDFRRNQLAILGLAVPGVAAAIALGGGLLSLALGGLGIVPGFAVLDGLVVAAALAATDPIAVVAIFKTAAVPRRLATLMEGESLLNDGTGVVLFGLLVAVAVGGKVDAAAATAQFVAIVGGGAAIGLAIGYVISRAIHRIDDPLLEITLTTVAAYAPFLAAEHFHLSGVIAAVTSGMLCGNYAARSGMNPSTRIAVESFWEYVAFALNSIVFLLIGFQVRPAALARHAGTIAIAYLALLAARAAVIYAGAGLLRRTRERFPWPWAAVITWGGLRGALAMVLPIALPADFPRRDLVLTVTVGVAALSLFLQGLTMAPLVRRLGLGGTAPGRREHQRLRARLRAARAALAELDEIERRGELPEDALAELRAEYQRTVADGVAAERAAHVADDVLREEELRAARRRLLLIEKDTVLRGLQMGQYDRDVADSLLADVDARLVRLDEHGVEDRAPASPA